MLHHQASWLCRISFLRRDVIETIKGLAGGSFLCTADIKQAISDQGVTVLKSPPGTGKSQAARQLIAERLKSGESHQVIWAVHSTVQEDALAHEAVRDFKALGVKVSIVVGKAHAKTTRAYLKQLEWSSEPEVKIVSFSHLPLIYDRHALFRKLRSDFLVIDELPLPGLIQQGKIHWVKLAVSAKQSAIMGRLADLCNDVAARQLQGTYQAPTDVRKYVFTHLLTGRDLLSRLGTHWSVKEWQEFTEAVSTCAGKALNAEDWVAALREDLKQSPQRSQRFGLQWSAPKNRSPRKIDFYGNVLTPLRALPPTLVLDAYAEQGIYDALFPEHSPRIVEVGEPLPLRVEVLKNLHLDSVSLARGEGRQRMIQVADEILHLHQQNKVSVLTTLSQSREGSPWQQILKEASQRLNVPDLPESLYHHAGRGKNNHTGRTIVSLMPPALPKSHLEGTLAALFPDDAQKREQAHRALWQAESLQMLHRGRQSTHGGRIITAYDPCLPDHLCVTQPYQPSQTFVQDSPNPRWWDATKALSQELLELFGGIPKSFLAALGFASIEGNANRHVDVLRTALERTPPAAGSLLAEWKATGSFQRYGDVKPHKTPSDSSLSELMSSLQLLKSKNYTFTQKSKRVTSMVYYPEGADPRAIFDKIYN